MATSQKPLSTPLTYSDYTKDVLKDLPPGIVLAEHMNAQNKSANSDNKAVTYGNNGGKSKILSNTLHQQNTIIVINVTGTRFEVSGATYSKLEPAILESGETTQVQVNASTGCPEIFIERHPVCFAAILDYYRSGELHMPNDVCPSVFKREIKYWRVQSNAMESCCLRKYAAFHSNEETLRDCHVSFTQWRGNTAEHPPTKWGKFRKAGWKVMDDPKSGRLAKVYLCVASFFVVLSIFLLAASTDSTFNRELNSNEWEEFMSYDDLYNYWDYIYPGKTKPDKNSNSAAPQDPGLLPPTSWPPSTNTPPMGPGPGRKKRSVQADDPVYLNMDFYDEDTRAKTDRDALKVDSEFTNTGSKTGTSNDKDNDNGNNDGGGDVFESNADKSRKRGAGGNTSPMLLRFQIRKSVEKVLKNYIKETRGIVINELDGYKANDIVDESLLNPIKSKKESRLKLKNAMNENKSNFDDVTSNDKQENDIHSKDKRKEDKDMRKEYQNDMDINNPGQYNDHTDTSNLSNEHQDKNQKIRHKRSVDTTTSGQLPTNYTLADLYNSSCIYLGGSDLEKIIQSLSSAAMQAVSSGYSSSGLPTAQTVYKWVEYSETACIAYFTVEFLLRILFAPSLFHFLFSFLTLMDIISLAAMYVATLVQYIEPEFKYKPSAMDAVNCLQITRVFRFFRLVKDVVGFRVLLLSVRTSWRELLLLLLYILMAVTFFATIVFFCERENMKSIPESAWWAIVTMTTVGYGDMAPTSLQGRLTGTACALSGVLLIAVTVPIFVNNFILFYEYSKITLDSEFYQESRNNDKKDNDDDKDKKKSESESNTTSIGLEPARNQQAFEMKDGGGGSVSRTSSRISLLSQLTTTSSKGRHSSSSSSKSPEVKSAASVSKVTPFVYDLELEQDGDVFENNNKATVATGRKPGFRKNNHNYGQEARV